MLYFRKQTTIPDVLIFYNIFQYILVAVGVTYEAHVHRVEQTYEYISEGGNSVARTVSFTQKNSFPASDSYTERGVIPTQGRYPWNSPINVHLPSGGKLPGSYTNFGGQINKGTGISPYSINLRLPERFMGPHPYSLTQNGNINDRGWMFNDKSLFVRPATGYKQNVPLKVGSNPRLGQLYDESQIPQQNRINSRPLIEKFKSPSNMRAKKQSSYPMDESNNEYSYNNRYLRVRSFEDNSNVHEKKYLALKDNLIVPCNCQELHIKNGLYFCVIVE